MHVIMCYSGVMLVHANSTASCLYRTCTRITLMNDFYQAVDEYHSLRLLRLVVVYRAGVKSFVSEVIGYGALFINCCC